MTWVDWAIVILLVASVLGGIAQGFFRTACSLIGLILGLSLASWNYGVVARFFLPLVRMEAIANAIGFFLIALVVMAIANIVGTLLGRAFDWLGLGCLDMIGGGILGFFQGVVMVTLAMVVALAFFPQAQWLENSRMARQFAGVCQVAVHTTPEALAQRVRNGIRLLEQESPAWMHPGNDAR